MRHKNLPVINGYIILLLLSFFLGACNSPKDTNNPVLSGPWLVTISTNDVGIIQTPMNFDVWNGSTGQPLNFEGYTKKGVDQEVLGFWKARLARLFSNNFKHGSIMYMEKGTLANESISGVLNTPFGSYRVATKVSNGGFTAVLKAGDGTVAGDIKGVKGWPKLPLRDYTSIMNKAIAMTQDKLYDPSILQTAAWQKFTGEMQRISKTAEDDATFVLAFFYFSHKYLPFSHYNIYHPIQATTNRVMEGKFVELSPKGAGVAYMRITSFGGGSEEMDSSFAQITAKGYNTLIVDLRDNSGGSIQAGMAFIRHLVPDTLNGGIFLTKKYFAQHTLPPGINQYKDFPVFTSANYDLLMSGISTYPGICLKAAPQPPIFKDKVYVLTNNNTASTCEPIVYLLKQYKLATVVGERTAGAMLNGEHFPIVDGFELTVPTATYYTADGYKIDKQGVQPNIVTKSAGALDSVMKRLH